MVDIMFVPVGGNGYTLDGIGALKLSQEGGAEAHYPDTLRCDQV